MQRKKAIGVAALAAVLTAPADGQERERPIRVTIGGYMEQAFGYASNRNGVRTFDATLRKPGRWAQMSDSEIWFSGRTMLGNGLIVGFNVQLEANSQNDQIDESYLFLDGAFGRLVLGSENDAAYTQHVGAPRPGGGWGVLETAATRWVAEPRFTSFLTTTAPLTTGDDQKVVYYTPRLAGLQLGGAFTPAAIEDESAVSDRAAVRTNAVTLSANLTTTIEAPWLGIPPIGIRASAGGVRVPPIDNARFVDQRNPIVDMGVGAQLALAGFTLGGGYRWIENPGGLLEGRVWAAGLAWARGRLALGASMLDSRVAGSATVRGTDQGRVAMVSGAWTLGPGIDLTGAIFQVRFVGEDPLFTIQDDNEGTGAAAGLKLSF